MSDDRSSVTLDTLPPGSRARIIHLEGKGAARRRLLDMGLVPGAEIEVIRKAPLGDPIDFKVKDYHLSFRRAEAEMIQVEPLEEGG